MSQGANARLRSEVMAVLLMAGAILLSTSAAAAEFAARLEAADGSEMILIPAGEFVMGSNDGDRDERPEHRVFLRAFYIDRYEVTHVQYAKFLETTGRKPPVDWPGGRLPDKLARHPVVNVTLADAEAYAAWAGKRLPTETEWEKACRGTDSRVYPWGNSPDNRKTASPIGDNSKDHTWPVGSFPDDTSPYGVQDLAGNAWEWTASWYDAYPGNADLELEYGQKFRVIRGGGAIDYYGANSTRRAADRARSLAGGTYDALGFRCVRDCPELPDQSASEARPASQVRTTASAPPTPPARTASSPSLAATRAKRVPLQVSEEAGLSRRSAPITTGLPFAVGVLRTNDPVRLVNEQGTEIPLQSQVTATWRDGSVRWLLLDFQADAARRETRTYQLELGVPPASEAPAARIHIQDQTDRVVVDTGPLRFTVHRNHFGLLAPTSWDRNQDRQFAPEEVVAAGLDFDYATSQPGAASASARTTHRRIPATPREVTIEEPGPLRSVIRVAGTFESAPGASAPPSGEGMEYVVRIHAFAGSAAVRIVFTAVRLGGEPGILPVERLATTLRLTAPEPERDVARTQPAGARSPTSAGSPVEVRVGGFPEAIAKLGAGAREIVQLDQLDEEQASLRLPGQSEIIGPRAPGWLGWQQANRSVLLVHHHFWQQFPKSFVANTTELVSELWPAAVRQPFDWDAGLAKTHEFWIDFAVPNPGTDTAYEVCSARARALDSPLRAVAAPEHYCGSGTFGALHPFDFDRFPEYETFVTAGADILLRRMATGFRHWGDYYYGGEFKGTNAFLNLEYDVHHNFLLQFARTGLRKYQDAAVTMAGHQSDIDTNHRTGWQWKHSPRHVETRAEFGHTFTRGLLEAWHFTGERRFLETARKLGDAFTEQIRDPRQLGNERQIGWALISLLPVYEATWDPKYFHAASNTVERLLSGLDARGRFAIRWDNRIAFFNGIAATGFLYYYRATGDERVADAILRVIRRTRGMYPEYAGRTLEAIAWACERENQPEDLELLARTFEATMAWQLDWSILAPGASTIFTVHALPFLAATGVARPLDLPMSLSASQFAGDHRHQAHRIPVGQADLFLEAADAGLFDVLVLRQGAWKSDASARVTDPAGSEVGRLEFPRAATVWQQQHLKVSNTKAGSYRIELRAPDLRNSRGGFWVSWDVVTSRPMRAVLQCPGFQGLEWVTPTLCAVPEPGANRVHLELAAEGEGFKKVVLLDPAGNIAASSTGFVDLGDRSRHRYRVTAEIPPEHRSGIWQFILQDVTLTRLEGLVPRFSTSPEAFFP